MKKLNLLLSLFAASLLLTSCLKEGDGSFSHPSDFAYITQDAEGLVYARTFYNGRGNFITSPGIKEVGPGNFVLASYSWNNENGTVTTSEGYNVYNVITTEVSKPFSKTTLNMSPAPTEPLMSFKTIQRPIFSPDKFFDDHWAFSYTYKGKEGNAPIVNFYEAERTENQQADEIIIDMRLNTIGTSTSEDKELSDVIVVNMTPLRQKYSGSSTTTTKTLTLKFRYYEEGKTEPVLSQYAYQMVVAGN